MIEQAMIFALGVLIAGLLALAAVPAVWRRALRLSVRRIEMQLPLSPAEISAERDHVRAEAAVAQRRLEQKLSALTAARADNMGELGRRATALADAEAARAALAAELETTKRALDAANAAAFETEKALHDALDLHLRAQKEHADLAAAHEALQRVADGRRASAAALEARSASLQLRLDDLHENLTKVEARLATKSHEAARLAQDLSAARSEMVQMTAARETLEKRFAAEAARHQTLQAMHTATKQEFESLLAELHAVKAKLDRDGRALADLRAQTGSEARTQDATMERAREAGAFPTSFQPSGVAGTGADMLLRQSIQEIGKAVIRLMNGASNRDGAAADLPRDLGRLRTADLRTPLATAADPDPR